MGQLDGTVTLITGGARGQGRAHAQTLARADFDDTAAAVPSLGRDCLAVTADARDLEAMNSVADAAIARFGRLDFVIANAGIAGACPIAEMSPARWQRMIDVNLTGVFNTFRETLPHMIRSGGGRLMATSSVVARTGAAGSGHYAAARAGVVALVQSLAYEVAEHGITVNAVLPAGVNTAMIHNPATYRSGPTCPNRAATMWRRSSPGAVRDRGCSIRSTSPIPCCRC